MTEQPDALMIFAAGFGTRMGALTATRPKPLIEVAGKALLDHALDLAGDVAPTRLVVNAHYKAEMVRDHLAGREVTVLHEVPEILDTGGGLKAALPHLGRDPVFTLNSDAIWAGPNPLVDLARHWRPEEMDALMLLIPSGRAHGREGPGDFTLAPDGSLIRGGDLVYSGAQIIRTEGLAAIPEQVFSLNRLWDWLAEAGRLKGMVYDGHWCDVGHPGGIAEAEALLKRGPHV